MREREMSKIRGGGIEKERIESIKAGVQALVIPIENLATQMQEGRAKILKYPGVPFVDRALESVLTMLRKTFGYQAEN